MKEVLDWDEDYILNLPQGEHDWLEFKSSRLLDFSLPGVDTNAVLAELSKQVSAFANSGGGTIIYGIEDTPIGTPRTIDVDGGVSLGLKNGTKEWLEDVIPNLVDFAISSFNVYVVTAKDAESGIANNRGIFLVNISSSDVAPHQAKDKKYYARVSGKSQPIGHRLMMDILGRAKHPQLIILGSVLPREERTSYTHQKKDAIKFICRNVGKLYAKYVNGYIYIPSGICHGLGENIQVIEGRKFNKVWFDNTVEDVVGWKDLGQHGGRALTITRYDPVLPGLGFRALVQDLSATKEDLNKFGEDFIYWEIYADNAPKEEGMIKIADLLGV